MSSDKASFYSRGSQLPGKCVGKKTDALECKVGGRGE